MRGSLNFGAYHMKTVLWIASLAAAVALAGSARAGVNLITDGDFSSPNQGGGWSIYYPGVNGWVNGNGDGIEIGYSPIYGLPCANATCQNLEVNANTFDTDSQTVSDKSGVKYDLSFLYGGRIDGGPQSLNVYWDGTLLTVDSSPGNGVPQSWTLNSFVVTGTGSDTLTFASNNLGGAPSYGNEITNVSVAVPEVSTWGMLGLGFGGLGFVGMTRRRKASRYAF